METKSAARGGFCGAVRYSAPFPGKPLAHTLVAVPQMKYSKCSAERAAGKLLSSSPCEGGGRRRREGFRVGLGWMHRLLGFNKFCQVL